MSNLTRAMMMGAAAASGDKVYVDDVFSTFLYKGNGGTQSIDNGIDISGEGGLVWIKNRDSSVSHVLAGPDLVNAGHTNLASDLSNGGGSETNYVTSFSSNGFSVSNSGSVNSNNVDYTSWTFRKAPGFFDVVTYTGNNTAGRTVAHSLGSVPGMIVVKCLDATEGWHVYHRSAGATKYLRLDTSDAENSGSTVWNNTTPTSTHFTVSTNPATNGNGLNYVAYIFAHDDASFGTGGNESIIKCGSVVNNGSQVTDVNLGFEPEFVLIKNASVSEHWFMFDVMRGMDVNRSSKLFPNKVNAEDIAGYSIVSPTATGFSLSTASAGDFPSGTYIYMAIRRPNKPPEAATDVFDALIYTGTGAQRDISFSPAYADLIWIKNRLWLSGHNLTDRLRGEISRLQTNENYASTYNAQAAPSFDSQGLFSIGTNSETNNANPGYNSFVTWIFKRAPGFFDVVAYTGTGSATTINHNLGAVPSVVLIKGTNTTYNWYWQHYALGANTWMQLNNQEAGAGNGNIFNSTLPTSSVFSLGSLAGTNGSGNTYIAYLFGDLPGISKAGTYTGTGSNINVDCGFTAGARFVLIKRKDGSGNVGDWYVWDTARGILSGNDPYLRPNVYEADVTNTDYVDPLNAGFTVTSSAPAALNTSGGTYLFLAIA